MKKLEPFNIDLLLPSQDVVRSLRPTTKTDIYEGASSNFNEDGLFSTLTYGRVGTRERDVRFSYIDLRAEIIHPAIFSVLKRLKSLYTDIITGKGYAQWDEEQKDFIPSDMLFGKTGMAFFLDHIRELEPDKRSSKKRNLYVDVFMKYRDNCLMRYHLIAPAGLRDLEIDQKGRETQDEINDLYRKLISISNSINWVGSKFNDPSVDIPRRNLQLTANEIYQNLKSRLDGKSGLIVGKWGRRKIANGTRNVISSMDTTADILHSPRAPKVDDVQISLFQAMKGLSPIIIHRLKQLWLDDIFVQGRSSTQLINPNTLMLEEVELEAKVWDIWGTAEGLEKLFNQFQQDDLRDKPITVDGRYLLLVYKTKETFKVFRDIQELPNPEWVKKVSPITYAELFYLCYYEGWYEHGCLVTRYPINNMYSIYPGMVYVKTTTISEGKYELGPDWVTRIGYAREYPEVGEGYKPLWVNTTVVHPSKLSSLGADFDGDPR